MITIITKQTISILCVLLISLGVYFPGELVMNRTGQPFSALALADLLPAGCRRNSTLPWSLTQTLFKVISGVFAALRYFILKTIYQASTLMVGGIVFVVHN